MSKNGTDMLILVNTGTPTVPVYEVAGCQRDSTFSQQTAVIDVSCKDSRAQRVLPGRYSGTITLDMLYVPTNAAYQALSDAMRDGTMILIARQDDGVVTETVEAVVADLSDNHPDQDAAVVSISLTIDGFWTVVAS